MRPEVQAFLAAGPLPDEDAEEDEIDLRVAQLEAITEPVTADEARALAGCFGPDDCYGVAWTLLHLIETGPNPVFTVRPAPDANAWQHRLWQRCVNTGLVADELPA
ncbi:hypothetical protein ACFZBP_30930 [Streptomyces sp. NPDC008086]|uniref:hypothetical protein n=1 Tax=Streptomyces sp. NPDC008086 TaxID=3364807 RepID=UPI0036E8B5E1